MAILKIDRALYKVDDATKTYHYYGRNPDWKNLSKEKHEKQETHRRIHKNLSRPQKKGLQIQRITADYMNVPS
jgi:hypothetical protein